MLRRRSKAEPAAAAAAPDGYDDVVYPGAAFPQTHPDRLATLARLFGGRPRAVASCRVLELGCGDGGNLIPLAYVLPGAELVGIDLNGAAIARGRAALAALGLTNLRLDTGDIAALDAGALGRFDHVIAHGVYSWVPAHVRTALLALCRACLERDGTAFVSFNALPGWHLRGLLRAALLEQVGAIADPGARIAAARALLRRLGESKRYDGVLGREVERMRGAADALLYHDVLAPVNEPFSVTGFAAAARAAGLRFLCDADLHQGAAGAAGDALERGGDPIAREQELDVLEARMFRQAVLVREDSHAGAVPSADGVAGLAARADLRPPRNLRLGGRAVDEFRGPGGASLRIDHPLVKAALVELGAAWPRALAFGALAAAAAARLGQPRDDATLAAALLEFHRRNVIELHAWDPPVAAAAGERPFASALARRACAAGGDEVVTLRCETVRLEDARSRRLLLLLDGTRDSDALSAALRLDQRAARELPDQLEQLARLGLIEER